MSKRDLKEAAEAFLEVVDRVGGASHKEIELRKAELYAALAEEKG